MGLKLQRVQCYSVKDACGGEGERVGEPRRDVTGLSKGEKSNQKDWQGKNTENHFGFSKAEVGE